MVVLAAAYFFQQPLIVALVALSLGASAVGGTKYWVLGRPWPVIRRVLRLGPVEPESEVPPRFAQALGATGLVVALLLAVIGQGLLGWIVVGAVAALQAILAATGFCLGCRLYFLKWWVPSLFDQLVRRLAIRDALVRPDSVSSLRPSVTTHSQGDRS